MQISGEKLNKLRTVSLPRPPEPAVRPASLRGCALAGSTESKSPPGRPVSQSEESKLRYASLNFKVDPSGSVRRFRMVDDFLAPHMPFCICKAQTIFELEQRPLKKQTHSCHFSPFLPMSLCLVCCEAVQYDVQCIILHFLPVCTNIYIYI